MTKLLLYSTMIFVLAVAVGPSVLAQDGGCNTTVKPGLDRPNAPPVVFGAPYDAPALRIQLVLDSLGKPIANTEVFVSYIWDFWDCTLPVRDWRQAADMFQCRTDSKGRLSIPAFTVRPRGWCHVPVTEERKVAFRGIEISYSGEGCNTDIPIDPDDVTRYVRTGEPIILEGGCFVRSSAHHGETELAIAAERAQLRLIGYPSFDRARPLNQRVGQPRGSE